MITLFFSCMAALVAYVFLLRRLALRPRHCPVCRMTAEPLSTRGIGSVFPAFEIVHWCTRCARIASRQVILLLGD